MLSRCAMCVLGLLCAAGAAVASPTYSEMISGDLPNAPTPGPMVPIAPLGITHVAVGVEIGNTTDVDYINIIFPLGATIAIIDLDQGNPNQNSLLGVGPFLGFPTIALNDDDNDGVLDQYTGVFTWPTDSALDLTAALGGPIAPGSMFTIMVSRTGDAGFDGNGNPYKLEWNLYVYTAVPAAPTGALAGAGMLVLARRRRRD
ncbi:MAG: hypothetical protein ACREJO_15145 [Phycisphaerales bacterium]